MVENMDKISDWPFCCFKPLKNIDKTAHFYYYITKSGDFI